MSHWHPCQQIRWQQKQKDQGLCRQCGKPKKEGTECAKCKAAHVARNRRLRDERAKAGLCILCGGPLGPEDGARYHARQNCIPSRDRRKQCG